MGAILLDLDGTIADSRPGIAACHRHMLSELGHDPAKAGDITWVIGPPTAESVGRLLAIYGDDRIALGVATYRACYSQQGLYDCRVFPGIAALLGALQQAGHSLRVATSKRRDFAERVVEFLGLRAALPKVYGPLPEGGLEDKADLLAAILRTEALDPATTLMLGDRIHDMEAAHTNGLRAIGALWGYGGREELQAAGADALAADPADVPRIVAAWIG